RAQRRGTPAGVPLETGPRSRDGAVLERALVLLSGAQFRAGCSDLMKRILVLATTTGYQTRAFGEAAGRLGVELVFATDRCHMLEDPWQDHAIPIRFHDEQFSVDAILDAARARPFDGLVAVGDRPTVIAAQAAEALGLRWHPPAAAAVARNKRLFRERLRDSALPVPSFVVASVDADPRALVRSVAFPAVIKPA